MINDKPYWTRATFRVPDWYTLEQVMMVAPRCMRLAGEKYEAMGYTILKMKSPKLADEVSQKILCTPDARLYVIPMFVGRKPQKLTFKDIPDEAVPAMEQVGLTLTE
jgi:hypothetical protein|tara:strand:+ start:1231 stop:1551 length:321 start_codon:yes stop_codon:yes gene_type:complete